MVKDAIPARELKDKVKKARRLKARGFSLICRPGKASTPRLAVIVKKDFGLAVERNKARRRLRELFRKTKNWFKEEFDIIVIVYPELKELSFQDLGQEWVKTLREGGIVEESRHSCGKILS